MILDTNIMIYLLNGNPRAVALMRKFQNRPIFISVITLTEILAGSFYQKKSIKTVLYDLQSFVRLHVTEPIAVTAAKYIQTNLKKGLKKNFQDGVIAATALVHKMPVITNNPKDFRNFKGLKIIALK